MDMTATIAPKTDQQNYDDYLTGPRTVTISGVRKGSAEQPVNVELAEYPGKPFKPNKSMRRVLVSAWGADATAYVGRKLTLFGNPGVSYGGKAVGGIEISHMSHIGKSLTFALTATRGQRKNFTVKPLVEQTPTPAAPAPAAAPSTTIPAEVIATTEKAKADGNLPEYADYLKGQNAPAYVLEYINQQMEQ